MRAFLPLPLFLAGLLAGCAEGPFVDTPITQSMEKPVDTVLRSGTVAICYNASTPWDEVAALADESCAKHGAVATLTAKQTWQCRVTARNRAEFQCTIPGAVDEKGRPIVSSDTKSIEAWRKRTGKHLPRGTIAAPAAAEPAAAVTPAPQPPVPTLRPLTPADIAGKPTHSLAPLPVALPPPPPPLAPSGFSLEQGSWGRSFEE